MGSARGWRAACLLVAAGAAWSVERAGAEAPLPPARPALVELPLPPEVPPAALLAPVAPRARDLYLPIAAAEARARNLPPEVADAVMRVESGYDPNAVGGVGERGLMQVLPSTAAMLGFTGSPAELADPATNIALGVRYLATAWRLAKGDLCRTLMKYRAGHGEERMSPLSVEYCRRAKAHLALVGSPLGDGAPPAADFGVATSAAPAAAGVARSAAGGTPVRIARIGGRLMRVAPPRTAATSRRFWAAHTARIQAIEARLRWRRGGIMART